MLQFQYGNAIFVIDIVLEIHRWGYMILRVPRPCKKISEWISK